MKPLEMTKISVTGSKKQLQSVIDTLYMLELMDIDDYQGDLKKGDPFGEAEELSETLVDIRSLLSKLPEVETESNADFSLQTVQESLQDIEDTVDRLKSRKDQTKSEIRSIEEDIRFFRRLEGAEIRYEDLKKSEHLKTWVGDLRTDRFEGDVENERYEIFEGRNASLIVYDRDSSEEIELSIQEAGSEEYQVPETDKEGSIDSILTRLGNEKKELKQDKKNIERELQDVSENWRSRLESAQSFLTEKVEKAEAPINFATTEKTFIAQGWIPEDRYEELQEELCDAAQGKIHIQKEEASEEENPPVKHDNPGPVKPFEALTDLMSVPKYNEIDPSFVILLTFPLMFGYMIGDAGYGVTSLIVFIGGYKMFPKASAIFKSLMWASVSTLIFGLYFGEAFGKKISFFGPKSELTAATGVELFKYLPTMPKGHGATNTVYGMFPGPDGQGISTWTIIFGASAAIGLLHINFGYLLGFYNEAKNHGFIEAFLEKGSWIMLELAVAAFLLVGATAGAPLMLISVALLYKGEGIEGIVEIPSLLSNILSYLRLFGVAVAAFSLAKVVNALAMPLFDMGGVIGLGLGITMLVIGHTFNTFIKIIEGFLQGIRLHYVEMFSKFYEGGGRKYIPFGTRELS
jgi:V/A-type H+-transporting ATPase subunit I